MKHCAGISESESRGGELSDEDRCTRVVVLQVCIVRYIYAILQSLMRLRSRWSIKKGRYCELECVNEFFDSRVTEVGDEVAVGLWFPIAVIR